MAKKPSLPEPTGRQRLARTESTRAPFAYYANKRLPSLDQREVTTSPRSRALREQASFADVRVHLATLRRRKTFFWAAVAILGVFLVQLTFLSTSPRIICEVQGIKTTDCESTSYRSAAEAALSKHILNHSKITIDTKSAAADIKAAHPELEEAVIAVPLIGIQPTVFVAVSAPAYTLTAGNASYTLSQSGYITAAKAIVGGKGPVIHDETGESIQTSAALLPGSHVRFMQRVQYQLEQAHYQVEYFTLPKGKAYEVDVKLKSKPYIVKFNLQEDPVRQSGALLSVIHTLGVANPAEYIDVRVLGRAYYK